MKEYEESLSEIKNEDVIPVNPVLGVPVLERFTYIENDELANLFVNLLSKASSSETVNQAHPTFLSMIDRLTVDEARIIEYLKDKEYVLALDYVTYVKGEKNKFGKLAFDLTGLEFKLNLVKPENIDLYLNNLEAMRVLKSSGDKFKHDEEGYAEVRSYYADDIEIWNKECERLGFNKCQERRKYYEVTELGKSFIKSCTNNQ